MQAEIATIGRLKAQGALVMAQNQAKELYGLVKATGTKGLLRTKVPFKSEMETLFKNVGLDAEGNPPKAGAAKGGLISNVKARVGKTTATPQGSNQSAQEWFQEASPLVKQTNDGFSFEEKDPQNPTSDDDLRAILKKAYENKGTEKYSGIRTALEKEMLRRDIAENDSFTANSEDAEFLNQLEKRAKVISDLQDFQDANVKADAKTLLTKSQAQFSTNVKAEMTRISQLPKTPGLDLDIARVQARILYNALKAADGKFINNKIPFKTDIQPLFRQLGLDSNGNVLQSFQVRALGPMAVQRVLATGGATYESSQITPPNPAAYFQPSLPNMPKTVLTTFPSGQTPTKTPSTTPAATPAATTTTTSPSSSQASSTSTPTPSTTTTTTPSPTATGATTPTTTTQPTTPSYAYNYTGAAGNVTPAQQAQLPAQIASEVATHSLVGPGLTNNPADVSVIQQSLGLQPTGVFDPSTEAAIQQFQQVNKLYGPTQFDAAGNPLPGVQPDGEVGAQTWSYLLSKGQVQLPYGVAGLAVEPSATAPRQSAAGNS